MKISTRISHLAAATLADPRWTAVVARDAAADGGFYSSVATTRVYCRPSCAARPPANEHAMRTGAHTREEGATIRCDLVRPALETMV